MPITTDVVSSNVNQGEVYNNMWKHLSLTGRWFSPGPPVSSTKISDRHDITLGFKHHKAAPSRDLDFQRHKLWFFLFYSDLLADMDWIFKYHCLDLFL